jgi:hypothetical protein
MSESIITDTALSPGVRTEADRLMQYLVWGARCEMGRIPYAKWGDFQRCLEDGVGDEVGDGLGNEAGSESGNEVGGESRNRSRDMIANPRLSRTARLLLRACSWWGAWCWWHIWCWWCSWC